MQNSSSTNQTFPMKSLQSESDQALWQRAEKKVRECEAAEDGTLSFQDTHLLLHEMQVCKIELEMQIDEYRRLAFENELQAELFRAISLTSLFGYMLLDSAGKLLDVNDEYCSMSGYSREELLQLSAYDIEEGESTEGLGHHLLKLKETGFDQFETRHRAKGGWVYYVEINTVFVKSENLIIALIKDISDRKTLEVELQASEARYLAIIEDQTDMICRYKLDGRLTFVNEAYLRCFKKNRKQLIVNNYIPHIPEPDLSTVLGKLKEITLDKPIVNVQHRVIMPGGAVDWQDWVHRGIYSPVGSLVEYQAVGRDITEQKLAEHEKELNEKRLQMLLELNSMTSTNVDDILSFSLEAELVTSTSQFAFIGFLDDAEKMLNIRIWSKEVMATCNINSTTMKLPLAEGGLLVECVLRREPIVINDYCNGQEPEAYYAVS